MKFICIGRNYIEHARELNNPLPQVPVFFLKPSTSLLRNNRPFFYPSFSSDLHYELELIFRIGKSGKSVSKDFAHQYIDAMGLGIDFTARDLQNKCKEKGLPWEIAKAFDYSAVVGELKPFDQEGLRKGIRFHLEKNGERVQSGNSNDMIFDISTLITYISSFITLRTGDYIFTGTPAGVGPVSIGDSLCGYLEEELILQTRIK